VALLFPDWVSLGGHGFCEVGAELLGVDGLDALQELYGLSEVLAVDEHGEVDSVEVGVAVEASCEVGFGVGGGVEFVASGAQESEVSLGGFAGEAEDVGDEYGNGDIVS